MNASANLHSGIRGAVYEIIQRLRDHSPQYPMTNHEYAMRDLYDAMEVISLGADDETAFKIMRILFTSYIAENDIEAKAAAEHCTPMEYLGLSESEVFSIMGPDAE